MTAKEAMAQYAADMAATISRYGDNAVPFIDEAGQWCVAVTPRIPTAPGQTRPGDMRFEPVPVAWAKLAYPNAEW